MLVLELLAFRAAVQNMHVVRCRAVQGFIAGQPVERASRVATFDGAAYFPRVRLEDGSFRPVPSLNPLHIGVHMAARAERCRAMRGVVPGGGLGAGRPIPGGRPRERGRVGPSAVLAGPCWALSWRGLVESGPSQIEVAWLLCWVRCWVRCRVLGWRSGAGRCIRGPDFIPLVGIRNVCPLASLSLALFVGPVPRLLAMRCWII